MGGREPAGDGKWWARQREGGRELFDELKTRRGRSRWWEGESKSRARRCVRERGKKKKDVVLFLFWWR